MDYKKIFKNREFRLKLINLLRFIPTKPYLKMVYKIKTGKKLNLKNPIGFNEKINWLKVNDIRPEYTELVDKITVKKHIENKVGDGFCFPLLGVWDKYEDINFDKLPDKFVLKCNHDSGSVKIIKNKADIDHAQLSKFFNARLKINPFVISREYPYKEVKPKIFAEKYMIPTGKSDIEDYKFFCFNGEPKILFVATDRNTDVKFDWFDMDFNHLDVTAIHEQSGRDIEKPKLFEEMKSLARELSKGFRLVRIDLYEIEGKIYFGEYTFFPSGGYYLFSPIEWEKKLGDWIDIEELRRKDG